jgi:hypothetical protein
VEVGGARKGAGGGVVCVCVCVCVRARTRARVCVVGKGGGGAGVLGDERTECELKHGERREKVGAGVLLQGPSRRK